MRDPNRYGYSPDELQRIFGRSGAYEGDAYLERGGKKAEAPQRASGNGRTYSQVTRSDNWQMSQQERALAEGADRLDGICRTGARVTGGNAYRSKIEYHFNGKHGFGHGRSGKIEVPDDYRVIIHR